MISTGFPQEDQLRASTPDPRFDLNAPRINPLVASAPASLTKADAGIAVAWEPATGASSVKELWADMIDAARRDVRRFPSNARAHANLGIALANALRFDEAIMELRTALSLDALDYVAGTTLARLLATTGHFAEAKASYEDLLKKFPNSDSILLSLAYISLREAQPEKAERYVEEVLRTNKRHAFPNFVLGITRLVQGNLQGAIAALREATRLEVRTAVFHHALGAAYAFSSDNARAERSFRAALALSPDAIESWRALSAVLIAENRADEVLEILGDRVQSRSDDIESRELLAQTYLQLEKYASARTQLTHVLSVFGDRLSPSQRSRFHTNIATTFLLQKTLRSAERELEIAIREAPTASPVPYERLGLMYVNSDRLENAISNLRNAKSLFPKRQNVRRLLSTAYADLQLFDVAIGELRSFWKDGTAEANTYSMLGSLFDWIGDETNALAVMSEAYKRFPHDLLVVNNLAYVHLVMGEVNEARTVLASLPRHSQATVELVATRGLLHLMEGDRAGGVQLYRRAEEMAHESGRRELATRVRQRMYLEVARLAAKNGDFTNALSEAKRGLKLKPNRYSFQPQLEELIAGIEKHGRQTF